MKWANSQDRTAGAEYHATLVLSDALVRYGRNLMARAAATRQKSREVRADARRHRRQVAKLHAQEAKVRC